MSDWKVLKREAIFTNPVLELSSEHLQREKGGEAHWTVVSVQDGVAVIPITEQGEVVLISQYRPAVRERLWELPAGRVEAHETPLQAGLRELREEAGFHAKSSRQLHTLTPLGGICRHRVHVILAEELELCPTAHEPHEDITIDRFKPAEVKEMIRNGSLSCSIALGGLAQWLLL